MTIEGTATIYTVWQWRCPCCAEDNQVDHEVPNGVNVQCRNCDCVFQSEAAK
jgi:hypothetical protein